MKGEKSGVLSKQIGGSHYKALPIEPWEIIRANNLNHWEGNVLKYIMRKKLGESRVEALQKAIHNLEFLIEMECADKLSSTKSCSCGGLLDNDGYCPKHGIHTNELPK